MKKTYFYPEYFNYQPDYAEKLYKTGEILKNAGYQFITGEDLIESIVK